MSYVEAVKKYRSPREAMLELAAGMDLLLERIEKLEESNEWDSWGEPEPPWEPSVRERLYELEPQPEGSEYDAVMELPKLTEEKQEQRRQFAKHILKLDEYYGNTEANAAPEGYDSWSEVYVKGGPMWLHVNDRDCVMSYSYDVRRAMVADVEDDDPDAAKLLAADILKMPAMNGPGHGVGPEPSLHQVL